LWVIQFIFDLIVEFGFIFQHPGRKGLSLDLPNIIFFLHSENDPVASIVTYIYSKDTLVESAQFPEIEFTEPALYFNQTGELDILYELYPHNSEVESENLNN